MRRVYQFPAKDIADAEQTIEKWIASGAIPAGEYVVTRSIFRKGYYNAVRKVV